MIGWLSSVDHKEIGLRYIYTAFLFLILGGIEALILRLQLAQPEQHFLRRTSITSCFPFTAPR